MGISASIMLVADSKILRNPRSAREEIRVWAELNSNLDALDADQKGEKVRLGGTTGIHR